MRQLNKDELTFMLCSTGYLPPRTEEEELFFEQMYESYCPLISDRHIDVDSIINGSCRFIPDNAVKIDFIGKCRDDQFESTGHMAARNFENLPSDILDKIKQQHKDEDGDK